MCAVPFGASGSRLRKGLSAAGSVALMLVFSVAKSSEMDFGGSLALSLRGVESDEGGSSLQRSLTGTLSGVGYLWRPWFARSGMQLSLSKIVTEQDSLGGEREQSNDLLTGEANLRLFPLSRFPTSLFAQVSDFRVDTSGDLLTAEDVNILQRKGWGIVQQYRPRIGTSHYAFDYRHDETTENDGDWKENDELSINGSHSVTSNSFRYRLRRRDTLSQTQVQVTDESLQNFYFRHNYAADSPLSVENVFDRTKEEEIVDGSMSREDRRSLNSFFNWRPAESPLTLRGNFSVTRRDTQTSGSELQSETALASLGMNYQVSSAFNVSGDIGGSESRDDGSRTRRHFENLAFSYSPESVEAAPWRYSWGAGLGIGNSGESGAENIQSVNGAFRHGLSQLITLDGQRVVSLGLNQGIVQNRDSLHSRTETLTHTVTVAASSSDDDSTGRLQMTASDSRSRGKTVDRDRNVERLDDVVKTLTVNASFSRIASRTSRWTASVGFGITKIDGIDLDDEFRNGSATAGYTNNRWLQVPRLRFESRAEYSVRDSLGEEGESSDESRTVWDNRVDYNIGLLVLRGRLSLTSIDGRTTRSFSLSAIRHF
ncbi:MAG: hypothetical protein Kow006_09810 [Gammaproteobacteria bacterium]